MKVTNFSNLNAYDIFNKIVKKTEELFAVDYSALSFEEKCEYLIAWRANPVTWNKNLRLSSDEINELRCTLLKRANQGEPEGCYYLARLGSIIGVPEEDRKKALRTAADMGHVPSIIFHMRSVFPMSESYRMAQDFVDKIPTLESPTLRLEAIRACYPILRKFEGTDKYPKYDGVNYDYYIDVVREGDANAAIRLEHITSIAAKRAKDEESRRDLTEECEFWRTVIFMVNEHFYKNAHPSLEESVGYSLINGSGCERDERRGALHIISAMQRSFNEHTKSEVTLDRLVEAMRTSKAKDVSERVELVKTILSGDEQKLQLMLEGKEKEGTLGASVFDASCLYHYGRFYIQKEKSQS